MNLGLQNRRCIITGASHGIGAAIAKILAEEGVNLVLIARGANELQSVASELAQNYGVKVSTIASDIQLPSNLSGAIRDAIEMLNGVDILINNAGTSAFGSFDEISDDEWNDAYSLKLLGYVRAIRLVLPQMREQRSGRIINIVGMAGRSSSPNYTLGCFNAALLHLTKSLGDHLAVDGITVAAVNPGATATDRILKGMSVWAQEKNISTEEFTIDYLRDIPLGRFMDPLEVARVVAFMCSDLATGMSGSSVQIDGGAPKGVF